jgi:hypothetical protein
MDDYLSKPIEFDKLVAILQKYLSSGANELELKKVNIEDISKRFEIPFEIAEQLVVDFKNDIKKDLEQLNNFIINAHYDEVKQKAYYIKNSCLTLDLLNAIEVLEKIENLTKKEDLLIEFDKLNKIILFTCMA